MRVLAGVASGQSETETVTRIRRFVDGLDEEAIVEFGEDEVDTIREFLKVIPL
jgi:hypothetical protein